MFRSLVFTALAAPHALTAANDELAGPADRAEIMMTVRHMLDALRQGDPEAAYEVLSDEFREEAGSAYRFMESMRKTCRPLCQARLVEFDCLSAVNGLLVQEMMLTGTDGTVSTGYFLMERGNFGWEISSCIVDTPPKALHA